MQSPLQADKFQTFQSGRRNQFQRNEHLKKKKMEGAYTIFYLLTLEEMQALPVADLSKSHDSWDNVKNKESRIYLISRWLHIAKFIVWIELWDYETAMRLLKQLRQLKYLITLIQLQAWVNTFNKYWLNSYCAPDTTQ